jgi:hypothetical protein
MINEDDYYYEDYKDYNDKKWTTDNIKTLVQWNCIAAYNIEVLDMSISMYQKYMRWNVIFGLIMSTTSGAISASRFSADPRSQLIITFNYIFTFMAFSIAIFTGAIKIYQVQENLETFIRVKQEWINFSTLLVAEFQLPLSERQDAVTLIKNNKSKYLDLLKTPINVPKRIREYGEDRIKKSTRKALDQSGFDVGHELVDIIYHMNTRLLFDVDNLVKYNKNGLSKNLKALDKNSEVILTTSDINLIPETIGRIRKNSFRIQPKLETLQSIQNSVNSNNNDTLGITIDEIEKNNECDYIFSDCSTTECSPNNLNSNDYNGSNSSNGSNGSNGSV